ncbi:MAG: polyphosphate kinase 1, partial [Lewinella sp.]|nr:polyphosphate kinase 1 [Lewinella sp.]
LEHARIWIFGNDGEEEVFLASADWMSRNLLRRIEVATPIYDAAHRRTLRDIFLLQWRDNRKARVLDADQRNDYRPQRTKGPAHRAQEALYQYLAQGSSEK